MNRINCITTFSGIDFNPLEPAAHQISTLDIAHALSMICRANGHYRNFFSVAQHSLNCAQEAKLRGYSKRLQLACLLHDASEAYISDITRPIKNHLTEYLVVEKKLQNIIYTVYGLADLTTGDQKLIKEIDDAMLAYEMEVLMDTHVNREKKVIGRYDLSFTMMDEVKEEFIKLTEKLLDEKSINNETTL